MNGSQDFYDPDSRRYRLLATTSCWPRAAVFDCDGLLIDTAACWRRAFTRAAQRTGRQMPEAMLQRLNGASIESASETLGLSAAVLRAELTDAFRHAELTALPGAPQLLERLRQRMSLAIATNGPLCVVSEALQRVGLRDAFPVVVSAESQPRAKPAPDVYLAACAQLGVHPSDTIAFEDSALGAQAARDAGLTLIVVPSDPCEAIPADLRARRLDDQRIVGFLRLEDRVPVRQGALAESAALDEAPDIQRAERAADCSYLAEAEEVG